MIIGIDGSRAFLNQRTGIEEYSYQTIKHLTKELLNCRVVLYLQSDQEIDFPLPDNWKIKKLWSPRLWTQFRLSLELLFHPVDVLFVPAHTVPIIHPVRTVVTIHGLEYEFVPRAYSRWGKFYMRLSIKKACRWAKKIISVSKNTKNDLEKMYLVPEEKIFVIHEGYENNLASLNIAAQEKIEKLKPYVLFVGRLEERKNVSGIIDAFILLKNERKIPHKLILAGKEGYGFEKIKHKAREAGREEDIVFTGFISGEEKLNLMKNAEVFLFPTFYEGFGLPILEAQSVGVPVVASNTSSIPEVAGGSALLADPTAPEFIAKLTYDLISNRELRDGIIKKGYENVRRFSWEKCAREIAELLLGK